MPSYLRYIIISILMCLILVSAYKLSSYYLSIHREAEELNDIANTFYSSNSNSNDSKLDDELDNKDANGLDIHSDNTISFSSVRAINNDVKAWIYVEGTRIDYPVMSTPNDIAYYIDRDINQSYSVSGVPFLDESKLGNISHRIVYGHHLKNGGMFGGLVKYNDEEYRDKYRYILYYSEELCERYDIIATFYLQADSEGQFEYYNLINYKDEYGFNIFSQYINEHNMYNISLDLKMSDEYITLSTCSYNADNERLVVIARKI